MIQLNYRDAKPIYEQIRDGIRRLVLLGAILPGEAVIPVRELSSKLAINPATIHRAYQELETEGYLYAESDGTIRVTDVRCEDGRKEELMEELANIKEVTTPDAVLLVVDAMTGQDSVNIAKGFNEAVGIDGVILSKLDGDTRGGAAISVKAVCGKPIMFSCIGEKLTDIEPFYPDRMASRILGMGDVLTLIDKAQEAFDEKQAIELEKKIRQQRFDLNDFLGQMEQMKNLGSLSSIAGMIPGLNQKALANANIDDKQMDRVAAIIKSMTPGERENPSIINSSRKQRIAAGCGMQVQDVNRLLRQFEDMQKMMKQFTGKGAKKKLARFGLK